MKLKHIKLHQLLLIAGVVLVLTLPKIDYQPALAILALLGAYITKD